mmetsp:Transcript_61199/g.101424  ORF Transcript_61199/g.101424 Transcript_61199/m.101424 type:complete len:224 (-) Transcript_61199:81-752(-)
MEGSKAGDPPPQVYRPRGWNSVVFGNTAAARQRPEIVANTGTLFANSNDSRTFGADQGVLGTRGRGQRSARNRWSGRSKKRGRGGGTSNVRTQMNSNARAEGPVLVRPQHAAEQPFRKIRIRGQGGASRKGNLRHDTATSIHCYGPLSSPLLPYKLHQILLNTATHIHSTAASMGQEVCIAKRYPAVLPRSHWALCPVARPPYAHGTRDKGGVSAQRARGAQW